MRTVMKISRIAALAISMFVCSTACGEVIDKVIVVVNDEVITQREFDRLFRPVRESYEKNFQGEELKARLAEAEKMFLEQIINSKIAVSLAKEQEIEIDEEELQGKIDRIRSYYSSEEEFLGALSDKGTNLTEFEQELREQMLSQEIVEKEVASKIVITPSRIREIYDKNRDQFQLPKRAKVRGIMVRKKEEGSNADVKRKIGRIASDIKKGKDFASLARENSEGPFAEEGGDMGYIAPGQMLEEIDAVIFSMKKGETSDVVETEVGYHIFMIEDIEEPRIAKLSEVSDFIKAQLHRKMFEEKLSDWLKEKRKNAYISYK